MPKNLQTAYSLIRFDTPLGEMMALTNKSGICRLEYTDSNDITNFPGLQGKGQEIIITEKSSCNTDILQQQLEEYFQGKRREFTIPLVPEGTAFQLKVWNELLKIPYGKTRTYMQQALALKKPEATRAVAAANANNKIAILIPCHRVVGAKGELTGYRGGIGRKQWLLDMEKTTIGERLKLF